MKASPIGSLRFICSSVGRWTPWIAGLVFFAWCLGFSWHGPGLQYDEALSVRGALLLTAPGNVPARSCMVDEVRFGERCWPVMVAPYVGAVKDYIAAPLFLLFGIDVFAARMSAALLGAIGIVGFTTFIRDRVSIPMGAAVGLAMAVHPAYLDQVLFDNGNVAVTMGFIGLAALAANAWCQSKRGLWMFLLGLACGAAVWGRLNFVWVIASVAMGAAFAFSWRALAQARALLLSSVGAAAGVLPLLIYHLQNPSALQSFLTSHGVYHSAPEFFAYLIYRLRMLSEILFSDGEHRAIWTHSYFDPGNSFLWSIVPCAAIWSVARRRESQRDRWVRCTGWTVIALFVLCLGTQLPIAEHHLIVFIPFLSVCLVVMVRDVAERGRGGRITACVLGVAYFAGALTLNTVAAIAIHRTGGVGLWSDAINTVTNGLQADRSASELKILDWGLQANLLFVSKTNIEGTELFGDANANESGRRLTWRQEVAQGGQFLTTASQDRVFPDATAGFEKALKESEAIYRSQVFTQKNGEPYAILDEVKGKQ